MADTAPAEREKMTAFINDPDQWPLWPVLPMKRDWNLNPNAGYLIDSGERPMIILYIGNIYAADRDRHTSVEFDNLEAMFDQGWRID
jgi:hypothetical protein